MLENCGVLLLPWFGQMGGASIGRALLSSCWLSWLPWCCQQLSQSDDWAACEQLGCLSLRLDLILSWDLVWWLTSYTDVLYPKL
jgi:hypothetical protein